MVGWLDRWMDDGKLTEWMDGQLFGSKYVWMDSPMQPVCATM